jgi:membrane protease YdiL (CAAX protease family)
LAVLYITSAMARAALVLFVLMTLVPSLADARDPAVGALFQGTDSPLGRAMLFSAAVVIAPLAEEVIFRGILLPGFARHMKTQNALVLSAILFGVFHIPSHGVGAIMPGVLGLVFGWARLRTGSLAAPMMLHAANNLFVTLLAWLAQSR